MPLPFAELDGVAIDERSFRIGRSRLEARRQRERRGDEVLADIVEDRNVDHEIRRTRRCLPGRNCRERKGTFIAIGTVTSSRAVSGVPIASDTGRALACMAAAVGEVIARASCVAAGAVAVAGAVFERVVALPLQADADRWYLPSSGCEGV